MRNDDRRRLLVEKVFRGDGDRLWGYVAGMLGDGHEAEDILQEVLMRALTARADLRDATAMRAYLFRSARNAVIDLCRHRKATGSDVTSVAAQSSKDDRDRETEFSRLASALGTLSAEEREVLALRYDGGLKYAEIARQMEEPLGTVLARGHRALRKLARTMRREEGE